MEIIATCRKDKINKHNQIPIYISITNNSERKRIATGVKVNIDDWNFEKNCLKESTPDYERVQFLLDSQIQDLKRKLFEYQLKGQPVILNEVLNNSKSKSTVTVASYFQKLINQLTELGKINTRDKYKFTLSSLNKFRSMDIPFTEITLQFLKDYEIFLRKSGQVSNSMATKFSNLKSVYNKALDEGVFNCDEHAFKKFKVGRLWTPTRKRAITKDDIHKLREIDLSTLSKYPKPYLEFSRNIFIFSYLTAGINFKDIAMLRYCDIDNKRIYYTRNKTQKKLTFQLLPDALKILEKYMRKDISEDDYIFPILDKQVHLTAQQKFDRIQKVRGEINNGLRTISKAMGLKHNLTTYVARHNKFILSLNVNNLQLD